VYIFFKGCVRKCKNCTNKHLFAAPAEAFAKKSGGSATDSSPSTAAVDEKQSDTDPPDADRGSASDSSPSTAAVDGKQSDTDPPDADRGSASDSSPSTAAVDGKQSDTDPPDADRGSVGRGAGTGAVKEVSTCYPPAIITLKYEIEEGRQDFEQFATEVMRKDFDDYKKTETCYGEVLLTCLSSFILQ